MTTKSYWISKYALSVGIKIADGNPYNELWIDCAGYYLLKAGKDAHETEAGAREAAEAMRIKKIASLKKQIAKLEKLEF